MEEPRGRGRQRLVPNWTNLRPRADSGEVDQGSVYEIVGLVKQKKRTHLDLPGREAVKGALGRLSGPLTASRPVYNGSGNEAKRSRVKLRSLAEASVLAAWTKGSLLVICGRKLGPTQPSIRSKTSAMINFVRTLLGKKESGAPCDLSTGCSLPRRALEVIGTWEGAVSTSKVGICCDRFLLAGIFNLLRRGTMS